MYGYVYLTVNNINGRMYVGQHKYHKCEADPEYLGSGIALERAVAKYGKENFTVTILCTANTRADLDVAEKKYIKEFREKYGNQLYNIADGGQGGNCYPMTEQRRKHISEAMKGKVVSQEQRQKISKSLKGHLVSAESREKSRRSNTGQKRSELCKKHLSENHAPCTGANNAFYGKHHTKDARERIGASRRGKKWINNGIKNACVYPEEVPEYEKLGWKIGMTPNQKSSTTIPSGSRS